MLCDICSAIFECTQAPERNSREIHHTHIESLIQSKTQDCIVCLTLWSRLSEGEISGRKERIHKRPDRYSEYIIWDDYDDGCWRFEILYDGEQRCMFTLLGLAGEPRACGQSSLH